ncbi:hypothetical protein FHS78_002800 [Parvibaculum indicum]|uniref:hypothetical protein n=1 Tax=Parvibaculum indicum TaxID=562969 RepID=UPI00142199E6|nr:hypothetical protein [Parvibaculum indicum]NIJ42498.1 hypothetical protein [Parvibaculum indicum]
MAKLSRARIILMGLGLAFAIALPLTSFVPTSEARPRISTGRELYAACKALAAWHLNPVGHTPIPARNCRQYIVNYFTVIHYLHTDEAAKKVFGNSAKDPYACLNLDGPRSYDQLAARIVRTAEWHPELMDTDAVKLMSRTFLDRPPCTDNMN